jgi:hypothetical protein
MWIASACSMLGEPLVADDAQLLPSRLARPEEAHQDRDEEYAAGYEPPGLHGVSVSDRGRSRNLTTLTER